MDRLPEKATLEEYQRLVERVCAACERSYPPSAPPLLCCSGCLCTRYCDATCKERDRTKHEHDCPEAAVLGLKWTYFTYLRAGVVAQADLKTWATALRKVVDEHSVLPAGPVLEAVSKLLVHARLVVLHSPCGPYETCYHALMALSGKCAVQPKSKREEQEAFLHAAEEMIANLPTDSALWTSAAVLHVCLDYARVLLKIGPAKEALSHARHVTPLLEQSLEKEVPDEPKEERTMGLLYFLKCFVIWLDDYGLETCQLRPDGRLPVEESEELMEAEAVTTHAICVAEAADCPEMLAYFCSERGSFLCRRQAYDEALKLVRRGMQLRHWPEHAGRLVSVAIHCLVNLRKDVQAVALIKQTLVKARRNRDLLGNLELGRIHYEHAVLLYRGGAYKAALKEIEASLATLMREGYKQRGTKIQTKDQCLQSMVMLLLVEVNERLGRMKHVELAEESMGGQAYCRPSCVVRVAGKRLASGRRRDALKLLRQYASSYGSGGFEWFMRNQWREGEAVRPLEMLRDLLEEGDEERAQVEAVIQKTTTDDEKLRQQALEELQAEMRQIRERRAAGGAKKGKGASKASRKKRKKRARKQQQRATQASGTGSVVDVDLAGLSLTDEGGQAEAGGAGAVENEEEDEEECPMCLHAFGDDDEQEDGEDEQQGKGEVLGCGHRYHGVCIDRWLCKCQEKGLLPTCPMCRREVVRGGPGRGGRGEEAWAV